MSAAFRAVQWNRRKVIYDVVLLVAVATFIGAFMAIGAARNPPKNTVDWIDLRQGAAGTCALLMLTVILAIGPLARLNPRFLVLLYNRRHFGVLTFLVAAYHGWTEVEWYAAYDALPKIIPDLFTLANYTKFIGFQFKALGLAALVILFLLAATSHDFWLAFLSPRAWKSLHMLLYVGYGLVVMHVALGAMQFDQFWIPLMLFTALATVAVLHLLAAWRGRAIDRGAPAGADGWIALGAPSSIPDKGARIVAAPGGERIAVFRDGSRIGAIANLCAHQNGPLGEGAVIDGCITCPWHGYQYRLEDGCSPPPYTEKLVTYRLRLVNGIVEVDPKPLKPGTPAAISWTPERL